LTNERWLELIRIYGIPCSVRSPKLRRAIHVVLRQIQQRAPEDFKHIRLRVRKFAPYTDREEADGQVIGYFVGLTRFGFALLGSCSIVELSESSTQPTSTVAHELGHICTRSFDLTVISLLWTRFNRRGRVVVGDVRSHLELCADLYAYKWGFGRHLDLDRRLASAMIRGIRRLSS
jgi:hypothetical protein